MKKIILTLLLVSFYSSYNNAVQNVYLRGKVINEKNKPVNNLRIRFVNVGERITTDSGEFLIELPDYTNEIEIEIIDNKWELQYPVDGRIPLLNDQNIIYKIVVKDNIDEIVENYKEIKKVLSEIGLKSEEMINWSRNFTESESNKSDVDENEIKIAIQRSENREEPINDISHALLTYNLAAHNMKDFFNNLVSSVCSDYRVLQELTNAVTAYNAAYNDIEINKFTYQNQITLYWENQQLPIEFMSIINYSTDELHKLYMLELGKSIAKINELCSGTLAEDEADDMKLQIQNEILNITRSLGSRLTILELKIDNFLTLLKDQNII